MSSRALTGLGLLLAITACSGGREATDPDAGLAKTSAPVQTALWRNRAAGTLAPTVVGAQEFATGS